MTSGPSPEDRDRVVDAVQGAMTVEFASGRDGKPQTFPLTPFWDERRGRVVVTSPPAYAGKVEDAKENPHVAFLVDRGEGADELLVRGEATVYDTDHTANRRYVRRLIDDQPDGFKKDTFQSSNAFIRSPLGWLLLGWYSLRVVVAVEPTAVETVDRPGPPSVDAWSDVGMDAGEAASYDRAVFTAMNGDGWPASRPVAEVAVEGGNEGEQAVRLAMPDPPAIEEGQPTCLLLHWHSDDIGDLGQRLVRGRASPIEGEDAVRFIAGSSFSMRNETAFDALEFILEGKRRTMDYFDADGGPLDWVRY